MNTSIICRSTSYEDHSKRTNSTKRREKDKIAVVYLDPFVFLWLFLNHTFATLPTDSSQPLFSPPVFHTLRPSYWYLLQEECRPWLSLNFPSGISVCLDSEPWWNWGCYASSACSTFSCLCAPGSNNNLKPSTSVLVQKQALTVQVQQHCYIGFNFSIVSVNPGSNNGENNLQNKHALNNILV